MTHQSIHNPLKLPQNELQSLGFFSGPVYINYTTAEISAIKDATEITSRWKSEAHWNCIESHVFNLNMQLEAHEMPRISQLAFLYDSRISGFSKTQP